MCGNFVKQQDGCDAPFGGKKAGVREDIDRELLPEGALHRLENARIERPGRIVRRRGYARLSADLDDGAMPAANRTAGATNNISCGSLFARLLSSGDDLLAYIEEDSSPYSAPYLRSVLATRRSGEWRAVPNISQSVVDAYVAPLCSAPQAMHRMSRASYSGTVACAAAGAV